MSAARPLVVQPAPRFEQTPSILRVHFGKPGVVLLVQSEPGGSEPIVTGRTGRSEGVIGNLEVGFHDPTNPRAQTKVDAQARKKYLPKTKCRSGYVMNDCQGYKAPKTSTSTTGTAPPATSSTPTTTT